MKCGPTAIDVLQDGAFSLSSRGMRTINNGW
jgi:hypothetical protein